MKLRYLPKYVYGLARPGNRYDRSYVSVGPALVDLPTRRSAAGALSVMRRFPYLVYCDSRDPNSASQQVKWARHGFLPRDRTLFVCRLYRLVAKQQIRQLEEAGVSYLFFAPFELLDTGNAQAVFYPYHTNTNQIAIKQPGPIHIFLGHGDSDKAGSINPMTRMYDHVFVAGDLTIQRLVASKVFTTHDAAHGRGVRVGMPYLKPVDANLLAPPPDGYILYAPTWEGVEPRQHYSSLEAGFGSDVVDVLLRHTALHVVFRPHPSTGQKMAHYRALAEALIARHAAHPRFHVHGDVGGTCPKGPTLERPTRYTARCSPSDSLAGARWVIADISSMLSSALYMGRPVAVIRKASLPDQSFRVDVLTAETAFAIDHGQPLDAGFAVRFADGATYNLAVDRMRTARSRAISVEPYLADVPVPSQVDTIIQRLHRSEYRR